MRIAIIQKGGNEIDVKIGNVALGYAEVVLRQMRSVVNLLQSRVREKVSGEVLQKKSGKLYDSIQTEVAQDGNTIIGRVFSDGSVPYFDIQERGGQTAPHDIVVRNAKALRFLVQTGEGAGFTLHDEIFAHVVHHPGSKIPAHWFMRDSLREALPVIHELFAIEEV